MFRNKQITRTLRHCGCFLQTFALRMCDRLLQLRVRVRLIERASVSSGQRLLGVSTTLSASNSATTCTCTCACARLDRLHTSFPPATSASGDCIVCSLRHCSQPSLRSGTLSPRSQLRPTLDQRRCRRDAVSLALVFRPEYYNNSRCRYSQLSLARSLAPPI